MVGGVTQPIVTHMRPLTYQLSTLSNGNSGLALPDAFDIIDYQCTGPSAAPKNQKNPELIPILAL
jgi:hypothetical protein